MPRDVVTSKSKYLPLYCNNPFARPISLFFNDTATTEIYTLSLHDALPISNAAFVERLELGVAVVHPTIADAELKDRKSTRLNSSHHDISYAVFCLIKKGSRALLLFHFFHIPGSDPLILCDGVWSAA